MQGLGSLFAALFTSLIPICIGAAQPTSSPDLTLSDSAWVWTNEATSQPGVLTAPAGPRGFRRTFTPPSGKVSQSADILISADDQFILTVNGNYIGASSGEEAWKLGQYYTNIPLGPGSSVFAAHVSNSAKGAAGLIATIKIYYDSGDAEIFRTNSTWLTIASEPPMDFDSPNTELKGWTGATSLGMYGIPPWYTLVETQAAQTVSPKSSKSDSTGTMATTTVTVQTTVTSVSLPASNSSSSMANWIEMWYAMILVLLHWLLF